MAKKSKGVKAIEKAHKKFVKNYDKLSPKTVKKVGDLLTDMIIRTDLILNKLRNSKKKK